ncbi:MAG TPA: PDZ domain-containing protein [Blastocatellia bacterium]|nr:PDZ domain-containing protein [Blastocatellia bacterium]
MRKALLITGASVLLVTGALVTLTQSHPAQSRESRRTGFLGVYIDEVTAEKAKEFNLPGEYGVIISRVEPESPAAKAGLKENDVIIEYNGIRVEGTLQFNRLVRETPPGRTVTLRIVRDGKRQDVKATIGSQESALRFLPFRVEGPDFSLTLPEIRIPRIELRVSSYARLGVSVQSLTRQLGEYFGVPDGRGVLITYVAPDSPAERAGLKAGDVITALDGKEITSPYTLTRELSQREGEVTLTIVRNKQQQSVTVRLERRSSSRPRSPATEEEIYTFRFPPERHGTFAEDALRSYWQWMREYREQMDRLRDEFRRELDLLQDQMRWQQEFYYSPGRWRPILRQPGSGTIL